MLGSPGAGRANQGNTQGPRYVYGVIEVWNIEKLKDCDGYNHEIVVETDRMADDGHH